MPADQGGPTEPGALGGRGSERLRNGAILALFAAAIFLNAVLLFSVEPMFTKMVLPLLGGTPAVWNTALLFFQAALLVGYLYAHLSSRLAVGRQAILHLALLAAALIYLPVHVAAAWRTPPTSGLPIPWLLGLLSASLGLPFLVLAGGAPMLQRWFSTLRHPASINPYMLYAASNLGSFAALLSYPTLIEPRLTLHEQSGVWLRVFYGLIVLIGACAVVGMRHTRPAAEATANVEEGAVVPNRSWRLRWLLLSFAPSSLLLGVTTYLSTDIAAVPFMWTLPLALYLLTFVLVFADPPLFNREYMLWVQLVMGMALIVTMSIGRGTRITTEAGLHLLAFFATTMVCHRELADARPRARHLTEYYLWMSLGGVLGGVFNVLVAPQLYKSVVEYPFAIIIAIGLRPSGERTMGSRRAQLLDLAIPAAVFAYVYAGEHWLPKPPGEWFPYGLHLYLAVAALAVAWRWQRPLRLALGAGAIYSGVQGFGALESDILRQERSFYGVYRVREDFQFHLLQNGTTTHGGQNWLAENRLDPITYYHREGPFGSLMSELAPDIPLRRVGVVGLGTGATSCFGRKGERWTFYEIDPLVPRLARDLSLFTYLAECPPTVNIRLGDARLSLATEPDSTFDLIILDAFSSDAIPVHLMTREALQVYLRKLRPDGAIAFHISNRYLDLRSVMISLGRDAGLPILIGDMDVTKEQRDKLYYGSRWVVVGKTRRSVARLARHQDWTLVTLPSGARVWTDDYSDVLGALKWN